MFITDLTGEPTIKFLNGLVPLTAEIIALAKKETYRITVKKNALLSCLKDEDSLFFIMNGLVRGFINDDDKDITVCIVDEHKMFGNIRNPVASMPLYQENFQALEQSELLIIPYRFIDELYDAFPEMNILARKLLAIHFHTSHERAILSRIPSAELRYKQFQETHPSFNERVPLKYLASYLGMRTETLSRIRRKNKPAA